VQLRELPKGPTKRRFNLRKCGFCEQKCGFHQPKHGISQQNTGFNPATAYQELHNGEARMMG
jgi:uncharacterized Fe-S radical SAM superfamily protein PflX